MAESDSATHFDSQTTGNPSPQPASFPSVQSAETGGTPKNIDFILEVMVNNKLVARGEVVVVNEKFGIRLTDVVSAAERVQHLR